MESVDLGTQFQQKQGELLAAWLLRLWDTEVDGITYFRDKIEWLASITMHPLLRQRLQNARWLMQRAPNQKHTLMEWINAAIHIMWPNVGGIPDTVSKWYVCAKLT